MADCVEEGGFWLPSEFLDDLFMDNGNSHKDVPCSDSDFCFPSEFPYHLELDHGKGKPHELATVMSTSPQSTLLNGSSWLGRSCAGGGGGSSSSGGSPNGVASPPSMLLRGGNDIVGDLINRAAGQVAKLKLNGGGGTGPGPTRDNNFLGPPMSPDQLYLNTAVIRNNTMNNNAWHSEAGQVGCPVFPNPTRVLTPGAGSAVAKKGCAGTGFFLPRGYENIKNGNNNANKASYSDSRKKTAGHSTTGYNPGKNIHPLNYNHLNGFAVPQTLCQPKINRGFVSDYDLLMARRNALMLQHGLGGHFLPPGWGY